MPTPTPCYRLEWRPAVEGAPPAMFISRALLDRPAVQVVAATLMDEGRVRDGEFRIVRVDVDGAPAHPARHVDADGVAGWPADKALPGEAEASAWRSHRGRASVRRKAMAAVRTGLVAAWGTSALGREQVADLLGIVEQAFDGIGPGSRRVGDR